MPYTVLATRFFELRLHFPVHYINVEMEGYENSSFGLESKTLPYISFKLALDYEDSILSQW